MSAPPSAAAVPTSRWPEILAIFLRLGCTSFGGPVAHLGFFRAEFVQRRQWLDERAYADLVALCQFLPGPASSQVGMALGLARGGWAGALAAWAGFTLPSALLLTLLALGLSAHGAGLPPGVLQGLKLVAVAVVAQAMWGMARTLCRGPARLAVMLASAVLLWRWGGVGMQLAVMLGAALLGGWLWGRAGAGGLSRPEPVWTLPLGRRGGALLLGGFALLLVLLPWLATGGPGWAVFDAFYRSGALVFGGGHVVLPLLEAEVVAPGWVPHEVFMAGYGLAQAVPGPLFTFAAFVGASLQGGQGGVVGAALCLVAIFLPAFLLVAGALPFWTRLRRNPAAQGALAGVNAAVVGLLLAGLLGPLGAGALQGWPDLALVLLAWAALQWGRCPPWAVVLAGAALGGWWLG